MRRRYPNEVHWQRAVACARRVHGSGWRRGLERHLGIEPGQLRAEIDRPMDLDQQLALDDKLAAMLRHHADLAYARCLRIDRHLGRLIKIVDAREAGRHKPAAVDDGDFEWETMFPEFFATLNAMKEAA